MEFILPIIIVGIGCGVILIALDNLWNMEYKSKKRIAAEAVLSAIIIAICAYLIFIFAFGVIIEGTK